MGIRLWEGATWRTGTEDCRYMGAVQSGLDFLHILSSLQCLQDVQGAETPQQSLHWL